MFDISRQYDEKRNFPRMRINAKASYTPYGGSQEVVTCLDLSSAGLMFETADEPQVGSTGVFVLEAGPGPSETLIAHIKIVRTEALDERFHQAGAEILTMK